MNRHAVPLNIFKGHLYQMKVFLNVNSNDNDDPAFVTALNSKKNSLFKTKKSPFILYEKIKYMMMHAMHVHGTSQRLKFRYTHPSSLAHFSWFPHCYMTCKVVVGEEENIYTAQHPPTSNRFITGHTLSKSCCCFYNNNTCYFYSTCSFQFSSKNVHISILSLSYLDPHLSTPERKALLPTKH